MARVKAYYPPRHGTMAAHHAHKIQGEEPCDACKRCAADRMAAWRRKNPKKVAQNYVVALARRNAVAKLVLAHEAEYERYRQEELAELESSTNAEVAEAKWWRGGKGEPEPGFPDG